jgi:hypothetical protein
MTLPYSDIHESAPVAPTAVVTGRRVAWSSVWSGFLIAVGAFLLMTVLGLAIGVSAADVAPGADGNARGLGIGAAVWSGISLLIALFLGGMVATRTGMVYDRAAGMTEGVLVWVLSILALIYMAASGIGMLSSGVFGALGASVQGATSAVKNVNFTDLSRGDINQVIARMKDPETARLGGAATGVSEQEARSTMAGIAQRVEAARNDPTRAAAEARAGVEEIASKAGERVERAAAQAQPYAATTMWSTLAAMVVALLAAIAGAMTGRKMAARELDERSIVRNDATVATR